MNIKYCLDSDRLSFHSIIRYNYRDHFLIHYVYVYKIIATYNILVNPSVNKLITAKAPIGHN